VPSGSRQRPLLLAALLALLPALLLTACGGDDDDGGGETVGAPAPAASDFPAPNGRTTEEIYASATPTDEVVVSPTGQVFDEGENRFGFGVFTAGREQITDAEVAIYAGPPGAPAEGPFPARIESLATEPEFTAQTTSADPDAAKVIYISEITLARPGEWSLVALLHEGESYQSVRIPSIVTDAAPRVPLEGDDAPRIHTPTADEVGDLDEIDTRDPHDTMHETDFADVLGEQPIVLVFATPLLCQSRVCGPVVDIAEQVKAEYGDEAEFIHMEIFEDNEIEKGERPQVAAYNLPTEPWLYVIDSDGKVSTAIEGAFSVAELEQAVQKVTG
jgi:hypothetical protein